MFVLIKIVVIDRISPDCWSCGSSSPQSYDWHHPIYHIPCCLYIEYWLGWKLIDFCSILDKTKYSTVLKNQPKTSGFLASSMSTISTMSISCTVNTPWPSCSLCSPYPKCLSCSLRLQMSKLRNRNHDIIRKVKINSICNVSVKFGLLSWLCHFLQSHFMEFYRKI